MSDPVVTEDGVVRSAQEAETLGIPGVAPSALDAERRHGRRVKMFDTAEHAATTFAEGVVDALFLGFIRETGDEADLRRDVHAPYAMGGNVLGFAAGMVTGAGPIRSITKTAEAMGAGAARAALRARSGGVVSRAAEEAAASMALAGGQAFGHQLMDSIIEDKEFSSEAILHEVKLAGILGAAGGVALGGLSKLAKRSDIQGQGGLVGSADEALKPHIEATRAYDAVLERHAAEVGALREAHKAGRVPDDFVFQRVGALNRAARARDALDRIDMTKAMSGTDDVLYRKWQAAGVKYRAAIRELDSAMQVDVPAPKTDPGLKALNEVVDRLPPIKDKPATFDASAPPVDEAVMPLTFDMDAIRPPAVKMAEEFSPSAIRQLDEFQGSLDDALSPTPKQPAARSPRDAGFTTREIDVPPSDRVIARSQGPRSANDLPDIAPRDQPGLTPPEPTGAGTPRAKRAAADAETPVDPADTPPVVEEPLLAAEAPTSKPRPLDDAEARVQAAMAELVEKSGGRLDSAGALGLLEKVGIRPAADNVGAYMDQVYALRKAGLLAADAARGVKTPLGGALKSALLGGAIGGPAGGVAAVAANMMYLRRGGHIAAATGRLMAAAAGAAQKLLSSTKVRAVAAAASNYPHAYSDRGPIKDPVERIQEIQFLAANPEHIRSRVAENAADLADQPDLLRALQDRAVNQVQRLALRAPAVYFDKLGRALSPPGGKLREFFEYENAVHDLPGLLKQLSAGGLTRPQAAALRESWPSVHVKVASAFLDDPDRLRKLPRETLRAVENITGIPLTNAGDPHWLARQAQAWVPPAPTTEPGRPQAFNINPDGAPTPAQSNATGRAPGN